MPKIAMPMLLVLVAALSGPAVAGAPPSEALVIAEIDDVEALVASFRGSAAHRIHAEVPAVRDIVDKILHGLGEKLEAKIEAARTALGMSVSQRDRILAWPADLKGNLTMALVPVEGSKSLEPVLRYETMSKAEAEALREVVEILDTAFRRVVPAARMGVEDGVSVLRDEKAAATLAWSHRDGELILARSPHVVRLAIEAEGAGRWQAAIDRAVEAAGGGSGLRVWADVAGLARLGETEGLDRGARDLLRMLDVMGVRSAAWASAFTRGGGRDALHLSTTEDSMLRRFVTESGPAPWPGEAPAGTLFSVSAGAEPADLLCWWLEVMERTDAAAFANAQRGLENLFVGLGVDAQEDVLERMGAGIVLHLVATPSGIQPLVSAPVVDHDGLFEAGDLIAAAAGWERKARDDGILWVNPKDGTGFLLRADRFHVGKLAALATLDQKPTEGAASKAIRERLPADARAILVAPHDSILGPIRKALAPILPGVARALAPDGEFGKRLGAEALALVVTKSGVTLVHESTLAPGATWLAAAVVRGMVR